MKKQAQQTNVAKSASNNSESTSNSKAVRPKGQIAVAKMNALQKAENIAAAAKQENYASVLAIYEITPELVATLEADIPACRKLLAQASEDRTSKVNATRLENVRKLDLLVRMRRVQAMASAKYARDLEQRHRLNDFYINSTLDANTATLSQYAAGMAEVLATESIPGVSEIEIARLIQARVEWLQANESQIVWTSTAAVRLIDAEALLASINNRRIQIQYAIEAHYPAMKDSAKEARAARGAFELPRTRPFRASRI
jgi:hypothetical protein